MTGIRFFAGQYPVAYCGLVWLFDSVVGCWDAYMYLDWELLLVSSKPRALCSFATPEGGHTTPLNTPTQSASLQTTLPRSPPTSLQTTFARSAASLPRHTTVTLAISHFYMLEADYLFTRRNQIFAGRYLIVEREMLIW